MTPIAIILATLAAAAVLIVIGAKIGLFTANTVRLLLTPLLRLLFRVRLHGAEHLAEKTTLVCNHQSLWDGILLAVFLQSRTRRLCFPIDTEQAKRPIARQIIKLVESYPLNPMEPQAVRHLIRAIHQDPRDLRPLVFPEGRITTTGGLMKIYPGAGVIAEKISAGNITVVTMDGLQRSTLSRMRGKFRLRWFPQVTIRLSPPQPVHPPAHLRGDRRRQWMAHRIGALMENAAYQSARAAAPPNLTRAFAQSARASGATAPLFAEVPTRRLNHRQTFTAAVAVGKRLRRRHGAGDRVGLLLPSSVGAAVCFYAALFQRLTPVMLNPAVGEAAALSACKTATLNTVYTSQKLLDRSPPTQDIVTALRGANIHVVLLEDLRAELTLTDKLTAAAAGVCLQSAARRLPGAAAAPDDHAAILFTSGSEGTPKGVVLTHANLIANSRQVLARIAVTSEDSLLNALPVFHAFGLLAGVILPIMAPIEAWQYPSPLHYKLIPEVLYHTGATLFFSANTFLHHYGAAAHPADFTALRQVFAGAEKLRDATRTQWSDKFGVRLMEGYGVTEASPAIAVNSPVYPRSGTVGKILPGIDIRLDPVPDIPRGGRLHVRGENIMAGYFLPDSPGELRPPPDGWHDTGDIAAIDADGYLTIMGRAKRFIKIAGEMAPLDGIEECLKKRWPSLAVVGIPDPKRGETLAAALTEPATREELAAVLKEAGLPDLWQPRHLKIISELPQLSTGKTDYPAVTRLFHPLPSATPTTPYSPSE